MFWKIIGFGRFPCWCLFSIFSKIFRECFKASLFIDTTTFGIPLGKNCISPLNGTQREGCEPQSWLLDVKFNHCSTSKNSKSNLHHLAQVGLADCQLAGNTVNDIVPLKRKTCSFLEMIAWNLNSGCILEFGGSSQNPKEFAIFVGNHRVFGWGFPY